MPPSPTLDDDEDSPMATINTTPLVDVMLVLLIIFLITIPVVTHTVPVSLPKEISQPIANDPAAMVIAIDQTGALFWNEERIADDGDLSARLKALAAGGPGAAVRIRGDQEARYEVIAKLLRLCGQAGIAKVGFITEPSPNG